MSKTDAVFLGGLMSLAVAAFFLVFVHQYKSNEECEKEHHGKPYVVKEKITDLDQCAVYRIWSCNHNCSCSILYATSCRGSIKWSEPLGKSRIEIENSSTGE